MECNVLISSHSYGGPNSYQVTERFSVDWNLYLADNKDIVVAYIDGRNSALKGNALKFAGYRRLGTVEIYDQINVTRYNYYYLL